MLFDLRGAGRRTTIKVVYLTLALLMGGGLVLFGIGGDVSGGLVDAITDRSGASDTSVGRYEERVRETQRATQASPEDPAAWAALARARFQLASAGENFDRQTTQFTAAGKAQLQAAGEAWDRHLELDPEQPDDGVASLMVQAYSPVGLNQPEEAVKAQEVITESRPGENTFANLAVLAYQAGQTRKGDLARKEALRQADKADREALKAQLDQAKQQAVTQQLQDAGVGGGEGGATLPEAGAEGDGGGAGAGGGGGGD